MSATRVRRPAASPGGESIPEGQPQVTPAAVGYGTHGHDFTLQAIMELQKSVGEMNANILAMRGSADSVRAKVDDLISWKNKILGGAAVLGFVFAFLGFVIAKAGDYVTIKAPAQPTAAVQGSAPQPQQPPQQQPPN